jgi:hypothetical protein
MIIFELVERRRNAILADPADNFPKGADIPAKTGPCEPGIKQ